jgi:hypothetical protein
MRAHRAISVAAMGVFAVTLTAFYFACERGWANPNRLNKVGFLVALLCFLVICVTRLVYNREVAREMVAVNRRLVHRLPRWMAASCHSEVSYAHVRRNGIVVHGVISVALVVHVCRAVLNLL